MHEGILISIKLSVGKMEVKRISDRLLYTDSQHVIKMFIEFTGNREQIYIYIYIYIYRVFQKDLNIFYSGHRGHRT